MANRKNTFVIKRSSVAGNKPSAGQVLLGELAINTADVILYASGTTADDILPIGWDRISRTGDTVTGDYIIDGSLSATTITADTLQLNTVTLNPTGTDILVRNSTTGVVDYRPVSGITTDSNTFVTGFTYDNNNTFTISDNDGDSFPATISQVSGLTVNGVLSATSIDVSNDINVGNDMYVTGNILVSSDIDAVDVSASNVYATTLYGDGSNITGIPHTTDTYVSGGTYAGGTATYTNSTGGTFTVTGFSTGSGTDTFVSGGTYSNGTATYTNSTGGTFSVTGFSDTTMTKRHIVTDGFVIDCGTSYLVNSGAKFLSFDGSGDYNPMGSYNFGVPSDYVSGGTFYIKLVTLATTDKVVFVVNITSRSNGGDMATPTDSGGIIQVVGSATDYAMVETAAIVGASSTFSPNKNVVVRLNRDSREVKDTYEGDALVWSIVFEYTGIK